MKKKIFVVITLVLFLSTGCDFLGIRQRYPQKTMLKEYEKHKETMEQIVKIVAEIASDEENFFLAEYYDRDDSPPGWVFKYSKDEEKIHDISHMMSDDDKELMKTFLKKSKFGYVRKHDGNCIVFATELRALMYFNGILYTVDGKEPKVFLDKRQTIEHIEDNFYYFEAE